MPQEGVVQKATASAMPVMGMLAMFSVAGFMAGIGASIYRRTRRNTSREPTYEAFESMENGPME